MLGVDIDKSSFVHHRCPGGEVRHDDFLASINSMASIHIALAMSVYGVLVAAKHGVIHIAKVQTLYQGVSAQRIMHEKLLMHRMQA